MRCHTALAGSPGEGGGGWRRLAEVVFLFFFSFFVPTFKLDIVIHDILGGSTCSQIIMLFFSIPALLSDTFCNIDTRDHSHVFKTLR